MKKLQCEGLDSTPCWRCLTAEACKALFLYISLMDFSSVVITLFVKFLNTRHTRGGKGPCRRWPSQTPVTRTPNSFELLNQNIVFKFGVQNRKLRKESRAWWGVRNVAHVTWVVTQKMKNRHRWAHDFELDICSKKQIVDVPNRRRM